MGLTTDPTTPGLPRGNDETPRPQAETYLVLSDDEIAKGFRMPVRQSYVHRTCGEKTTMGSKLAETYARDPWFYSGTYCCACQKHRPLYEFVWDGTQESMDPTLSGRNYGS